MCLSVPVKILKLKKNKAIADFVGKNEEFDIGLVPDIKINDYALASNGFIIKKISNQEAEEIFKIIKPKKEEK
ncbi:MAG: HypC/HybG/HupF family hydrogenase formation chaperone [bacterium]|nr:HypC/HybG/HupF family hydrogenase formation chaperone [bacterium]